MYKKMSNIIDNDAAIETGWKGALADAERKLQTAKPKEKQRWAIVIGVIRRAIERREPWPGDESTHVQH